MGRPYRDAVKTALKKHGLSLEQFRWGDMQAIHASAGWKTLRLAAQKENQQCRAQRVGLAWQNATLSDVERAYIWGRDGGCCRGVKGRDCRFQDKFLDFRGNPNHGKYPTIGE